MVREDTITLGKYRIGTSYRVRKYSQTRCDPSIGKLNSPRFFLSLRMSTIIASMTRNKSGTPDSMSCLATHRMCGWKTSNRSSPSLKRNYQAHSERADLFIYFLERALSLFARRRFCRLHCIEHLDQNRGRGTAAGSADTRCHHHQPSEFWRIGCFDWAARPLIPVSSSCEKPVGPIPNI